MLFRGPESSRTNQRPWPPYLAPDAEYGVACRERFVADSNEWYKRAIQGGQQEMMSFIWWLIIGLIAGALARLIMPGRDPMGIIATIVLGIVGSILGGLVSWAIWGSQTGRIQPAGLLLSILGAIIVLWIWRMVKSRSTV